MLSGIKRCRDDVAVNLVTAAEDDVAEEEVVAAEDEAENIVAKDDVVVAKDEAENVVAKKVKKMKNMKKEMAEFLFLSEDEAENVVAKNTKKMKNMKKEMAEFLVPGEDEGGSDSDDSDWLIPEDDDEEEMEQGYISDPLIFGFPGEQCHHLALIEDKKPGDIWDEDWGERDQIDYSEGWQQPETITSLIDIEYYKKKPDEVWKEPPTELNLPLLWMVHCPSGKERELAVWLMQNSKVHDINNHDIRSAISFDHLHNYIYVESDLERHVRKACKALDESYYATSKITSMSVEDTMVVLGLDSKSVDLSQDVTHENNGNAPSPALPSTPAGHDSG